MSIAYNVRANHSSRAEILEVNKSYPLSYLHSRDKAACLSLPTQFYQYRLEHQLVAKRCLRN